MTGEKRKALRDAIREFYLRLDLPPSKGGISF
jgi:hypothetical protein